MSSTADVVTLAGTITAVVVPIVGTLVLSIVNFIKHHTSDARTIENANRVAKIEGQLMNYDKQIADSKNDIGTVLKVVGGLDPDITKTVDSHDTQIQALNNQLVAVAAELKKIQAVIPASDRMVSS